MNLQTMVDTLQEVRGPDQERLAGEPRGQGAKPGAVPSTASVLCYLLLPQSLLNGAGGLSCLPSLGLGRHQHKSCRKAWARESRCCPWRAGTDSGLSALQRAGGHIIRWAPSPGRCSAAGMRTFFCSSGSVALCSGWACFSLACCVRWATNFTFSASVFLSAKWAQEWQPHEKAWKAL